MSNQFPKVTNHCVCGFLRPDSGGVICQPSGFRVLSRNLHAESGRARILARILVRIPVRILIRIRARFSGGFRIFERILGLTTTRGNAYMTIQHRSPGFGGRWPAFGNHRRPGRRVCGGGWRGGATTAAGCLSLALLPRVLMWLRGPLQLLLQVLLQVLLPAPSPVLLLLRGLLQALLPAFSPVLPPVSLLLHVRAHSQCVQSWPSLATSRCGCGPHAGLVCVPGTRAGPHLCRAH